MGGEDGGEGQIEGPFFLTASGYGSEKGNHLTSPTRACERRMSMYEILRADPQSAWPSATSTRQAAMRA